MAAVVRGWDGRLWLGDPRPVTMLEDFRPGTEGAAPDVTIAGGRMPRGAVHAVVTDRAGREHEATCGRRAWVALLPQSCRGDVPMVCFLDAAGEVVPVPVPHDVRVEPVPDAAELCPVCGVADWARVVEAPLGRYPSAGADRPTAAVCRRCGHEERLGVLLWPGGDAPDPAELAQHRAQRERAMAARVRSAPFRLYGLAAGAPRPAGYGSDSDGFHSVTLAFTTPAGEVSVETSIGEPFEPPEEEAERELAGLLNEHQPDWPAGSSETAISLWFNARRRERETAAASAPVEQLSLPVDGAPAPFTTLAHDGRFAAVARLGEHTITLSGHGDPRDLALATVAPSAL